MFDFLKITDNNFSLFIYQSFPHTGALDIFFATLSGIGELGVVWIIFGIFLYVIGEIKHKEKIWALIWVVLLSLVFTEYILKNLIRRSRPDVFITSMMAFFSDNTYAFPSFHATVAFACAYVLAKGHKKLDYFYYGLAVLIAFSRIYLGKHYILDVLAGSILGLLIGYVSVKITDSLTRTTKKKG